MPYLIPNLMKKCYASLMVLFLLVFFGTNAHAQFEEGTNFINAQLTGLDIAKWEFSMEGDEGSSEFTQFGLNLAGGHYFQDDMAAVLTLGYLSVSPDEGGSFSALSVTAGVRRHFGSNFFVGGGLSLNSIKLEDDLGSTNDLTAYLVALEAGYTYFLTERVAIEPGINYAYKFAGEISADYNDDDIWLKSEHTSEGVDFDLTRMGFSIGIAYYF